MHMKVILCCFGLLWALLSFSTGFYAQENKTIERWVQSGEQAIKYNLNLADSIGFEITKALPSASHRDSIYSLVFLAKLEKAKENYPGYFAWVKKFKQLEIKNNNLEGQLQTGILQLHAHRIKGNFKEGLHYSESLEKKAKSKRSFSALAQIYNEQALCMAEIGQKDSAEFLSDKAIQYARRSGRKNLLFESFHVQSQVYTQIGKYELAVSKALVAYKLAQSNNHLFGMVNIATTLGQQQLGIDNIRQANTYFSEAFEAAKALRSRSHLSKVYSLLGECSRKEGNLSAALDYQKLALESTPISSGTHILGFIYLNQGKAFADSGEYSMALESFNRALNEYAQSSFSDLSAQVYFQMAEVSQKNGHFKKALKQCQKALQLLRQEGHPFQIPNLYLIQSELHKKLGNTSASLSSLQEYVRFQQEYGRNQSAENMAELSELYLTEERDRMIAIQADSLERQQEQNELTQTRLEIAALRNNLQAYVIVAFCIFILLGIIIGYAIYRRRALEQRNKEAEMSQTLLRTQMNPHFIFNAMSVIQSYIYENDVKNSTKFLVNFSRLMRLILENSPKEFISIEVEIDILKKYLETQKLRFEDRFEFEIECEELVQQERAMIPPMITQPFIENAIEHGQLHTVDKGLIKICFQKRGDKLEIVISDNGVGRAEAEKNKKGKNHKSMATQITKDRIENLNQKYKTSGYLKLTDADEETKRGTKVLIALPYKTEDK